MKKIILILIGTLIMTSVSGCKQENSNDETHKSETTISYESESESEISDVYTLSTSYGDFTITDSNRSAKISKGEKISGDLEVRCYGQVNYVGEETEYEFDVPVLTQGAGYTIVSEEADIYRTSILYTDSVDGFYSSIDSSNAGTITILESGEVVTKYDDDTLQKIGVTLNDISTPWYTIKVSGENTGFNVKAGKYQSIVSADKATNVDISLENDFNSIDFTDVAVDSSGVSIIEGNNGECKIEKMEQGNK